ncbi:hypothetical protein RCH18_002476 [Flavobacterium sp. PL11]|uniref:hypothetical protein n=1 Tax=Flavobacterium sp. PL11 TaxID=3071717 RepID=UPI002DFD53F1|nr:hypothetical protein [Flavobacterium sp. PL11]
MQFIPGWTDFTLDLNFRLDSMISVKGLKNKPFAALLEKANIIDINNLIIAKKTANRRKDQLDVVELEKVNNNNRLK